MDPPRKRAYAAISGGDNEVSSTSGMQRSGGGGQSAGGNKQEDSDGQSDPIPRSLRQQSIYMRFTQRSLEELSSDTLKYLPLCSNLTSIFDEEQLTQFARVYDSDIFNSFCIHNPKASLSNFIMLSDQLSGGNEISSFVQRSKIVMFTLTERAGMEACMLRNGSTILQFAPDDDSITVPPDADAAGVVVFKNGKTNKLLIAKETDFEDLNIVGMLPRSFGNFTDGEPYTHTDGPFVLNAASAIKTGTSQTSSGFLFRNVGILTGKQAWGDTANKFLPFANVNDFMTQRTYGTNFAAQKNAGTELEYPTTTYIKNSANWKYISEADKFTETIHTNYPKKIVKSLAQTLAGGNPPVSTWTTPAKYNVGLLVSPIIQKSSIGASAGGVDQVAPMQYEPHYCTRGSPPLHKNFFHTAVSKFEDSKPPPLRHHFFTMITMQKANGEPIIQRTSCLLEQEVGVEFHFIQDQMDEAIGDNDITPMHVRGELRAAAVGKTAYVPKSVFYF